MAQKCYIVDSKLEWRNDLSNTFTNALFVCFNFVCFFCVRTFSFSFPKRIFFSSAHKSTLLNAPSISFMALPRKNSGCWTFGNKMYYESSLNTNFTQKMGNMKIAHTEVAETFFSFSVWIKDSIKLSRLHFLHFIMRLINGNYWFDTTLRRLKHWGYTKGKQIHSVIFFIMVWKTNYLKITQKRRIWMKNLNWKFKKCIFAIWTISLWKLSANFGSKIV